MKKLNEKYRGSGFDNYRGSCTRFSLVNKYFLEVVKIALGSDVVKEPANIDSWGRFSFPGEKCRYL